MDFFEKFKDIKTEEKIEENLEKEVAIGMKDLPAKSILKRIIKGDEFTIILESKNREDSINNDPTKSYKPELIKFEKTLRRIGYTGGWAHLSDKESEFVYRPASFYPENLIVKFAQDNYDKLMEGIFEREKSSQMQDAYLFMALVKNKKEPLTGEEKQHFHKIWEKLKLPGPRYALTKTLIDGINNFNKEKKIFSIDFEYKNIILSEANDHRIYFDRLEEDVEKRTKAILELIETDPLGLDDCCACELTNSGQFVEDGWFAILNGATKHHGRWYCLARDPIVHYFVLENLNPKFGMPREYVKEQIANITSKDDQKRSPAKLAGIINRAYRIENERKPLEL